MDIGPVTAKFLLLSRVACGENTSVWKSGEKYH